MPEAPVSEEPITELLAALREGETAAAGRLWAVYYHLISELAATRLRKSPVRLFDQDDIAQSAFKSLCLGLRAGRFSTLKDRRGLWPVLISLTLRKTVDAVRHECRKKRGGTVAILPAGGHALDHALESLSFLSDGAQPDMIAEMRDSVLRLKQNVRGMEDERLEVVLDM